MPHASSTTWCSQRQPTSVPASTHPISHSISALSSVREGEEFPVAKSQTLGVLQRVTPRIRASRKWENSAGRASAKSPSFQTICLPRYLYQFRPLNPGSYTSENVV